MRDGRYSGDLDTHDANIGRPKEYDGKPVFLNAPDVVRIAESHGTTPGQVGLSWGVKRGTVVIPKSENPERIRQNITVRRKLSYRDGC